MQYLRLEEPLHLESGATLEGVQIAYHTYGKLNPTGDNAVWVCHALTSSSEVADWWPHTVETGRFLDPEKYFVVCANILGSCYGTTGPLSENPTTGEKYYTDFPRVTIRDQVECHRRLAKFLGIRQLYALIGSSMGGFQALEWSIIDPNITKQLILIATGDYTRPWLVAFNASMTMALEADCTYGQRRDDAGAKGLACARSIALLSYRGRVAYDSTQADREVMPLFEHRAASYQRYQGKKLVGRFNAYSYKSICDSVDSHDIARGREASREQILSALKPHTLVVAISSDLLFPPCDMLQMAQAIPGSEFLTIESDFAHDGFLVEYDKLNDIILEFYK